MDDMCTRVGWQSEDEAEGEGAVQGSGSETGTDATKYMHEVSMKLDACVTEQIQHV